jgi:hypothetical protein
LAGPRNWPRNTQNEKENTAERFIFRGILFFWFSVFRGPFFFLNGTPASMAMPGEYPHWRGEHMEKKKRKKKQRKKYRGTSFIPWHFLLLVQRIPRPLSFVKRTTASTA